MTPTKPPGADQHKDPTREPGAVQGPGGVQESGGESDATVQIKRGPAAPSGSGSGGSGGSRSRATAATVPSALERGETAPSSAALPTETAPDGDTDEMEGQVVDGRYRLIRPLATGGMGSVWLAEQLRLKRHVAIKVMTNPDEEIVERFRREAVALTEVSHPAIVEIIDFSVLGQGPRQRGCLVMAYIDGKDLADYLDETDEQRLDPTEARILLLPIVSALVELHANGIIHRDIKPDNIVRFLRADGRPGVKLVDFGIARRQVDQGLTASGYVLGTPPYLPPETLLGERHTPLSDIYALGATLFELLASEPPFGTGAVGEIMQRVLHETLVFPRDLEGTVMQELLSRMLDKVPSQRPDAMQVLQALEQMRDPLAPASPSTGSAAAGAVGSAAGPGHADAAPQRPTRPLARARAPSVSASAVTETPPDRAGAAQARVPGTHQALREPSVPAPASGRTPLMIIAFAFGALVGALIAALALTL